MRNRKILALFLIVFTVMLSSFTFYGYQLIYTPNVNVDNDQEIIFTIDKGMDFKELQDKLYTTRVVNDLVAFSFMAKLMGYHKNIQPGHYTIKPNMTNLEAIRYLRIGNPIVEVTFQNLRRIDDVSAVFAEYLLVDSATLSQYFDREEVQVKYGLNRENLIGLFMPDSYEFFYKATPEQILDKMKANYDAYWTEERLQKAKNLNLTPAEVTTLASIVKGETSKLDEAPRIAGAYLNRLRIGMRLQADPTLIFAKEDYNIRRVRKGDREVDSPYNTYKYGGLPPGPINMPEKAYLNAVLNAESHQYIYFCAKADFSGYHAFAKDFDTHLLNARAFQRALNQRGIDR
jgi:UPF0755 protein